MHDYLACLLKLVPVATQLRKVSRLVVITMLHVLGQFLFLGKLKRAVPYKMITIIIIMFERVHVSITCIWFNGGIT